jgi:HK97 family phage major capsid protein
MLDVATFSAAIKANGDLNLEIVGLPFGTDRQGQVFDAGTNIDLALGDAIPVYHYHGFAEIASKSVGRIGTAIYKGVGTLSGVTGHVFSVALDAAKSIAQKIYTDAQQGRARASSDSSSHLVRPAGIVGKPGRVTNWPIFAMSLMDADTADAAVNPRAIALAAAKAFTSEQLDELSGEAGAAKAGATFARRNRDRITAIKAMLDELMSEFPTEPTGDMPAAKSIEVIPNMSDINVEQLAVDAALEAVPEVVETPAPAVETPAVKTYTVEEYEAGLKAAAKAAAKSIAARRPVMGAPAVITQRTVEPMPFLWATKALQANPRGTLVFNLDGRDSDLEFDGSADAVKAFKAMATTAGSAVGEHFVPRVQTSMVIDAVYQEVVATRIGMNFPMPKPLCDMPTIGTFTAGWSAENASATSAGDATTAKKSLAARKLTALATLSNEIISDSTPAIETFVRNGISRKMGEAYDSAAFNGAGTSTEPLGLLNESGVTATAVGSDNVFDAVLKAVTRMAVAKLSINNVSVVMRPEVALKALLTRVGASGDYVASTGQQTDPNMFGGGLANRMAARLGLPVFITTSIPSSGSASSIVVVRGDEWVLGSLKQLELASSNIAGSAFANDQTLIRAILRADFALMRAASCEIITGVAH